MGTSIDKIKQGAANGIAAVEADALSKAFRSALSASGVEAPEFFDSELGEDVSPLLAALLADFVVGNDTLAGYVPGGLSEVVKREADKALVGCSTVLSHKYLMPIALAFCEALPGAMRAAVPALADTEDNEK